MTEFEGASLPKGGKLTDIGYIKAVMAAHNMNFKKKFGQNFLITEAVPKRIAAECGAGEEDGVLEIGPGIGTLTKELSSVAKKVVAVEIDTDLIPILGDTLADCDNVKVIHADIMKVDLKELVDREFPGMKVSVCANLPYYITTPVLMQLIETVGVSFENITVMVQKEVTDRICAVAGTENYGAITASIRYRYEAKRLFTVSAGNFMPAPRVDSAVLRLTKYAEQPVVAKHPEMMFKVITAAFAQRRKTLTNALLAAFPQYGREKITEAITSCGFAADVRGEKLDVAGFAALGDRLTAISE